MGHWGTLARHRPDSPHKRTSPGLENAALLRSGEVATSSSEEAAMNMCNIG